VNVVQFVVVVGVVGFEVDGLSVVGLGFVVFAFGEG